MGFINRVKERVNHLEDYAKYKDMTQVYGTAMEANVIRPKVYGLFAPDEVPPWDELSGRLPNLFVVRPTIYVNTNTYMHVRDDGDNGLFSFNSNKHEFPGDVIQAQIDAAQKLGADILFEEFPLCGNELGIPIAYCMHTFGGEVGVACIQAITPNDTLWFDVSKTQLGSTSKNDLTHLIPDATVIQQLCDTAERISAAIAEPYMRIDLINTTKGPTLRSFASVPGDVRSPQFAWLYEQYDEYFNELWIEAKGRIIGNDTTANTEPESDSTTTPDDNA